MLGPASNSLNLTAEQERQLRRFLRLLGLSRLEELPGHHDPSNVYRFIRSTASLIGQNGETWIKENRARLLEELQWISDMG